MQNAETILGIIRERGKRGLPLKRVYRWLYNPDLYLRAYARLSANQGAITPGATAETMDGMNRAKIERLIADLRHERFRWTPVRRVHIPKKNGKRRPLGLPTWTDKLLQEVMRSLLEAYFEPQFAAIPTVSDPDAVVTPRFRRGQRLDGNEVVHRGRHQRVLRQHRPRRLVANHR